MAEAVAAGAGVAVAVLQATDALFMIKDIIVSSNDMETINKCLNDAMKMLCAKRADHDRYSYSHRATKMTSKTYENWNFRVMNIECEVEVMQATYQRKRKRSKFVNFFTSSKFSEKMKSKSLEVLKLYEEGNQMVDILVEKEPEQIVQMPAPDIEEFSTLHKHLKKLLSFLNGNKVKCIRVHGMVGIGKTTVMQNLNNVAKMFDIVIWVDAPEENNKYSSMKQIQQIIVRRMKIKIEGNPPPNEVAQRIREELKDKKYLLLLDDVKVDIELDQIGVDPKNGSKVVLTTTVDHVCHTMVDMVIRVERLSLKEALRMFKKVLGRSRYEDDPDIEEVMIEIVKLCDGLPLVIKTVASAFKMKKSVQRWEDGLLNLKKWPEKPDVAIEKMYKFLNFCCDELDSVQKDCFFYSAMYPEDSDIHTDCLLDCWAAEDLYGSADNDEHVRVNCRDILENLKTVSLLEECARKEYVRMHKLIRKAALYKLSANDKQKHLVQEPPNVECSKQKRWLSLVDSKLQTLPEHPNCSMLSTLFLQKNRSLNVVSDLLLERMNNLRVLNLGSTGIASLPPTLSKLILLKLLYLNDCTDLTELPSEIGELEHLEVLDIRDSGVKNIPHNIQKLSRLRRLLVSFTNFDNGNDIHQDVLNNCRVISQISSLEELVVDLKLYKQCGNKMLSEVRDQVATLTKLTTLKFCFLDDVIETGAIPKIYVPQEDALKSFVGRMDDLDSTRPFQVFIGCSVSSPQIPKFDLYQRYLRYCDGEGCNPAISKLLAKTDAFILLNHNDLKHVSMFGTASMHGVRGCLIEGCHTITSIVDVSHCNVGCPMLPNLERLYIENLPELKCIWKGPVHLGSLSKLISLDIGECSRIEELFIEPGNACVLPNLRKLILVDLPNLRRFCTYASFQWSALEKLKIHGCPSLNELPFNKDGARNLKSIEAEQIWWEALEWQDPEVKKRLQPYCSLS